MTKSISSENILVLSKVIIDDRSLRGIALPRFDVNGERVANSWALNGYNLTRIYDAQSSSYKLKIVANSRFEDDEKVIIVDFNEYAQLEEVQAGEYARDYLVHQSEHILAPQEQKSSLSLASKYGNDISILKNENSELIINNFCAEDILSFHGFAQEEIEFETNSDEGGNLQNVVKLPNGQKVIIAGISKDEIQYYAIKKSIAHLKKDHLAGAEFYDVTPILQKKDGEKIVIDANSHEIFSYDSTKERFFDDDPEIAKPTQEPSAAQSLLSGVRSRAAAAYAALSSLAFGAKAMTTSQDPSGRTIYNFSRTIDGVFTINAPTSGGDDSRILFDGIAFKGNALPRANYNGSIIADKWSLDGFDLIKSGTKLVIVPAGESVSCANRIEVNGFNFKASGLQLGLSLNANVKATPLHSQITITPQGAVNTVMHPLLNRQGEWLTFANSNGVLEALVYDQEGYLLSRKAIESVNQNSGESINTAGQSIRLANGNIQVIYSVFTATSAAIKVTTINSLGEILETKNIESSIFSGRTGFTFSPSSFQANAAATSSTAHYVRTSRSGSSQVNRMAAVTVAGQNLATITPVSEAAQAGFAIQNTVSATLPTGFAVNTQFSGSRFIFNLFSPLFSYNAQNQTVDFLAGQNLQYLANAGNYSITAASSIDGDSEIIIPNAPQSRLLINLEGSSAKLNLGLLGINSTNILQYLREATEADLLPQDLLARGATVSQPNFNALVGNVANSTQSLANPRFAVLQLPNGQTIVINGVTGYSILQNVTNYISDQPVILPTPTPSSLTSSTFMDGSSQISSAKIPSVSLGSSVDGIESKAVSSSLFSSPFSSPKFSEQLSSSDLSSFDLSSLSSYDQPSISSSGFGSSVDGVASKAVSSSPLSSSFSSPFSSPEFSSPSAAQSSAFASSAASSLPQKFSSSSSQPSLPTASASFSSQVRSQAQSQTQAQTQSLAASSSLASVTLQAASSKAAVESASSKAEISSTKSFASSHFSEFSSPDAASSSFVNTDHYSSQSSLPTPSSVSYLQSSQEQSSRAAYSSAALQSSLVATDTSSLQSQAPSAQLSSTLQNISSVISSYAIGLFASSDIATMTSENLTKLMNSTIGFAQSVIESASVSISASDSLQMQSSVAPNFTNVPADPNASPEDNGMSPGIIAATAIASLVAATAIGFACFKYAKSRKKNKVGDSSVALFDMGVSQVTGLDDDGVPEVVEGNSAETVVDDALHSPVSPPVSQLAPGRVHQNLPPIGSWLGARPARLPKVSDLTTEQKKAREEGWDYSVRVGDSGRRGLSPLSGKSLTPKITQQSPTQYP